ncbi:TIGR03086 family metal-binding protein [Streptomyces sp. NPDC057249]|uniref:TIGR03086 family metal-binding protein n=1 Tax=Streptomyces sp. NPDC057249 TaxID=3346067 RepID=UPI003637820E
MKNEHAHMTECSAEAARVARGITAAQLETTTTPCADWDLRTLLNHWVLYTSHGMEHRARRTELPEELIARDFTADADWADRYADRLDRAVAAWSDPAVWEGTIGEGDSASPAADTAAMLVEEIVLHGWDVARATGQEFRISGEAAAYVLATVEKTAALYRQYEGFTDEVDVPGATGLTRALALSGRDPQWSAG